MLKTKGENVENSGIFSQNGEVIFGKFFKVFF